MNVTRKGWSWLKYYRLLDANFEHSSSDQKVLLKSRKGRLGKFNITWRYQAGSSC